MDSGTHNYMLSDVLQIAAAIFAFVPFLLAPGYFIAWMTRFFDFRNRSFAERVLISSVVSIACVPALSVLVGRFLSLWASILFLLALGAGAVILLARELATRSGQLRFTLRPSTRIALGLAVLWAAVAIFDVVDLQLGKRLYLSVTAYDYCVRTAMIEAALRFGVPPHNPFFSLAGVSPVLRYYYYWYVVCALPARLFSLPARACLSASAIWCGFALASIIPLYLKYFLGETDRLRRKSLIGIALLGVTGLDLVPNLLWFTQKRIILPDSDWWDPNQVTSWFASLLWVPHHVAALIACLTGFLVLCCARDANSHYSRAVASVFAALAFASAVGLSVYVTFTFAIFLILWTVRILMLQRFADFVAFSAAGVLTFLISLPYLHELRGVGSGARFAYFAIRDYITAAGWLAEHQITRGFKYAILTLAIMLVIYVVEFGFYFLAGLAEYKRKIAGPSRLTENQSAAWTMLAVSLLIASFLHSGAIDSNDLGMRSVLLAQFVLLLMAVPLASSLLENVSGSGRAFRACALCALLLGALGTLDEISILRTYAPMLDVWNIAKTETFMPSAPGMGERTFDIRKGYEQINRIIPPNAIVQHNPIADAYPVLILYSGHQSAAGLRGCGTEFGGDPRQCETVLIPTVFLYGARRAGERRIDIDEFCRAFSIDVLVATDMDPAWYDSSSWVRLREPFVANPHLRAVACGGSSR